MMRSKYIFPERGYDGKSAADLKDLLFSGFPIGSTKGRVTSRTNWEPESNGLSTNLAEALVKVNLSKEERAKLLKELAPKS
jgi:hypothetical protein